MSLLSRCFAAVIRCYAVLLFGQNARTRGKSEAWAELRGNSADNSGEPGSPTSALLRRGGGRAHRAAQLGGVVAAREERLDVARRLPQALAVLDERDPDKPLAIFAKAGAWRHRDIGALQQQLRE